ncbi:MAG: hypothetical protein RL154_567 [Pseudomonadota bacterium]|jgi:hypothetical protein
MVAYLILAHRYPEQFKRLFKAIYDPANYYIIHIDKRSGDKLYDEIQDFLVGFANTALLKSENAVWGGYSLVDAELRGIEELLKMGAEWEFFINLSAQDFPIKSQKYIRDFLTQNRGKDFMKLSNQSITRPDTLHRIENYVTESENEVSEPMFKRTFLDGVTPYIGNQWVILSRKFCEFVTHSPEIDRFKEFYQNTLIADEGFFQTVIMNTSYEATIVNDDKRAIDWVPMGTIKLRPRDFTANDADFLKLSDDLFARKFDETVDMEILNILDSHLSRPFALAV